MELSFDFGWAWSDMSSLKNARFVRILAMLYKLSVSLHVSDKASKKPYFQAFFGISSPRVEHSWSKLTLATASASFSDCRSVICR